MRITAFAVVLGPALPVSAADGTNLGRKHLLNYESEPIQMAQFQLPKAGKEGGEPSRILPQRLTYQYSIGTESEIRYRRNPDLNDRVPDSYLLVIPQLNGTVIYRPTDWLETTVELILEREFAPIEEEVVRLPSGEILIAPDRGLSLIFDQAFVTIKRFTAPFEVHAGRRNYEDDRHWLYDTSLDVAAVSLRKGPVRAEAFAGRQALWDLDVIRREAKDRINTYTLVADYRRIDGVKFSAFTVFRDDRDRKEGRPLILGVGAQGMPTENLSFWSLFAYLLGSDEAKRDFSAYGFDIGGTYRFPGIPFHPNVTLGYAFGTGDPDPNDNRNTEFRQTGMQSNETKFAGLCDFKVYGETVDPELSNLRILTAGLGFRPLSNVTVDLVYHRYRLDEIAEELRNSLITALMNQDETRLSKDVGSAFDVVLGIRNLFGVRRLGVDWRMGWFFPGSAFLTQEGDPDDPRFRPADKGSSIVVKFWY